MGDKGHGNGEIGKAHHNALKHGNVSHKDYAVLSDGASSSDSAGLSYSSD